MLYTPCTVNFTADPAGTVGCRRRGAVGTAVDHYISFRLKNATQGAFDSGLDSFYAAPGKVVVHSYSGFQHERLSNGVKPVKVADLNSGGLWRSPPVPIQMDPLGEWGGQLEVRVLSIQGTSATVKITRFVPENTEARCSDNIDNDGDGLTDEADCKCARWKGGAPCPSPPPAPPAQRRIIGH
jgi:hypothetical protein